jgi:hypothetical protein
MLGKSSEPWERRRARYLELAAEALRSASQAPVPEMRRAYLSIAYSWTALARETERRAD